MRRLRDNQGATSTGMFHVEHFGSEPQRLMFHVEHQRRSLSPVASRRPGVCGDGSPTPSNPSKLRQISINRCALAYPKLCWVCCIDCPRNRLCSTWNTKRPYGSNSGRLQQPSTNGYIHPTSTTERTPQ